MESIIQIIVSLLGIIVLFPIYIVSLIVKVISFGFISEKTSIIIAGIITIPYEIFIVLRFCYNIFEDLFPKTSKKISLRAKKNKLNKDILLNEHKFSKYEKLSKLNLNKPLIDEVTFCGNLNERKDFLEKEVNKINLSLNRYKDYFEYSNNKLTTYLNNRFIDLNSIKFIEEELSLLNRNMPIDLELINNLRDRINLLEKELLNDIPETFINYSNLMKGLKGEKDAEKQLSLFENRYKLLKNIRVELDGQSSESDMIIICEKGVFVVEIKNYGKSGQQLHISNDGKWFLRNLSKKGVRELKDVTSQNNYHCGINQTLINNELKLKGYKGKFIDCESIICIANDDVEIRNDSFQSVIRPSNIVNYVKSFNSDISLSEELQEQIYTILKANMLPEKKFDVIGKSAKIENCLSELKDLLIINENINNVVISYLRVMRNFNEDNIPYI